MKEEKEKSMDARRWHVLAERIVAILALAVLFLVPATALVGRDAEKPHGATFLVAWGGDGGMPAVALESMLEGSGNEAVVLLPGCVSAARTLQATLQNDGIDMLSALFLPTGAPYPKGAKVFLKGQSVRRIVVAEDSRSRGDWQGVIQEAVETGSRLERIQAPEGGRQWKTTLGSDWNYIYRRLAGGENEAQLFRGENGSRFVLRNLESGEFVLERHEGDVKTVLLELPRINHGGVKRIPMAQ